MTPGPGEVLVTFPDLGKQCLGCRASVAAELQQVAGTRTVQVNLRQQTAVIVFDPATNTVAALRAAVERAGYTPGSAAIIEG